MLDRDVAAHLAAQVDLFQAAAGRINAVPENFLDECRAYFTQISQNPDLVASMSRSLLDIRAAMTIRPPVWLVEGLLHKASLAFLYGAPGSYKSFLALDLLCSVASGTPFLGRPVDQGTAIYITAEGVGHLGYRLEAWCISRKIDPNSVPFPLFCVTEPIQLNTPEAIERLQFIIGLLGELPSLVVIDTLAACSAGSDENSAQDVSKILTTVGWLIHCGATVLLVHHATKGTSTLRGHSSLSGAANTVLKATHAGQLLMTLKCEKQKDFEPFNTLEIELASIQLREKPSLDEAPHSLVILNADQKVAKKPKTISLIEQLLEAGPIEKARLVKQLGDSGVGTSTAYRYLSEIERGHWPTIRASTRGIPTFSLPPTPETDSNTS